MKQIKTVFLATALCGVSLAAVAHHSATGIYDPGKTIVLNGVLSSVDYVNPHVQFHITVKDANGKTVVWTFGGAPPGWYRRAGIKQSEFTVGSEVTVIMHPALDGSPSGAIQKLTFPGGRTVSLSFGGDSKAE